MPSIIGVNCAIPVEAQATLIKRNILPVTLIVQCFKSVQLMYRNGYQFEIIPNEEQRLVVTTCLAEAFQQ